MSDKGVGEATQREFHVHFPLLCWVQGNPQTLYLQSPIISHQKIKEDFLGRVPKIPVDQPLEGNITQIHHDSTKAHPKCTRRSWGRENTQGKPFPLEARREELRFYLQTRLIISSDVRNEEEPRKQSWFLCFFFPRPFLWVFAPLPRLKCKRRFYENVHFAGRGGCDHREEEGSGGGAARQTDGMLERWKDVCRPRNWTFLDAFLG